MRRLGFALAGLLIAVSLSPGQPEAKNGQPAARRLDAQGDPLPPAALARVGTLRFRHRNQSLATMTPDGKGLVLFGREGLHDRSPDAATPTGHHRHLILQPHGSFPQFHRSGRLRSRLAT